MSNDARCKDTVSGDHVWVDRDKAPYRAYDGTVRQWVRCVACYNVSSREVPESGVVRAGAQVTVTIGRNVDTVPMSERRWHDFLEDVASTVRSATGIVLSFGPFYGVGEWEGITEESAVSIFVTSYAVPADYLDDALAALSAQYGQDAIAWSYGPNRLAAPEYPENVDDPTFSREEIDTWN